MIGILDIELEIMLRRMVTLIRPPVSAGHLLVVGPAVERAERQMIQDQTFAAADEVGKRLLGALAPAILGIPVVIVDITTGRAPEFQGRCRNSSTTRVSNFSVSSSVFRSDGVVARQSCGVLAGDDQDLHPLGMIGSRGPLRAALPFPAAGPGLVRRG